uniref:Uncharacterized protein n=1 Tax=viral metagenome TaxID=1070528 RepID=A0A6H1ZDN6_9ZZZZ
MPIKRQQTEEELLKEVEQNLAKIGKTGRAGATAAYGLLLKMKGLVDKNSKELFELTADDYYRIEQQAKGENDRGEPKYSGGEGEMPSRRDTLLEQLCPDNGQVRPAEDNFLETLDISDLPD